MHGSYIVNNVNKHSLTLNIKVKSMLYSVSVVFTKSTDNFLKSAQAVYLHCIHAS